MIRSPEEKFNKATKLLAKADKQINANKFNQAIDLVHQAMDIFSTLPTPLMVAQCYIKLGNIYELLSDYPTAADQYFKALEIRKERAFPQDIADAYRFLTRTHYLMNKLHEAREYALLSFFSLFRKSPALTASNQSKVQNDKGDRYKGGTDKEDMEEVEIREDPEYILELSKRIPQFGGKAPLITADAFFYLGNIYYKWYDYNRALFYFFHGSQFISQKEQPRLSLQFVHNLAKTYQRLGNYNASITMYLRLIHYYQQLRNYTAIMVCLDNTALNYCYLSENDKAYKYVLDSEELFKIHKKGDEKAFLHMERGKPSLIMKSFSQGSAGSTSSSPNMRRGSNEVLTIEPIIPQYWEHYYTLSEVHLLLGNTDKAEDLCEQAIEISEEFSIRQDLMRSLYLMARILISSFSGDEGDLQLILNYLREAREIAEELGDNYMELEYYVQKAILYKNTVHEEEIPAILDEAIKIAEEQGIALQLGRLLIEYGIYFHYLREYDRAREYFNKALDVLRETNNLEYTAKAHYNLACACSLLHYGEELLKHLKSAVTINPKYKKLAMEDEDFKGIRSDPMFLSIVEK